MSRAWAGDTVLVRTLGYTPRGQLKQLADSLIASPTCTSTSGTLDDGVVCTGGAVAIKSQTFLYDSAGDQTRQIDNLGGADSLTATYGAANRLNGIAGVTYTYDDDGNVASRTTASDTVYFTYDASSRLVTVRAGADTTFYGYNALGQLVTRSRNDNSGTNKRNLERVFFSDGDHLMAEMDSTLVTRVAEWAYYPGIDSPLGVVTSTSGGGTKLRFYHQDEIGNVIGLTDSSAIVQALEYRPWGEVVASTGGAVADTSRLQWKGLIWEGGKTQLHYVRNRWYDPVARRFISEDPIGIEGGINLYNFGASDPVNNFDPFGQACRRHTIFAKDIVNEVLVGIRILWEFIECDLEQRERGGGYGYAKTGRPTNQFQIPPACSWAISELIAAGILDMPALKAGTKTVKYFSSAADMVRRGRRMVREGRARVAFGEMLNDIRRGWGRGGNAGAIASGRVRAAAGEEMVVGGLNAAGAPYVEQMAGAAAIPATFSGALGGAVAGIFAPVATFSAVKGVGSAC